MKTALALHSVKQDGQAEEELTALLAITENWWPRGPHLVETLSWLGTVQCSQHKYSVAEPVLKRAVEVAESQGGPLSIAVGRAKEDLAIIARDETDEVVAERLFSEAAEILSKDPVAAWGDDAGSYMNLGYLQLKQGRYQEAKENLTRAVNSYERLFHATPYIYCARAHFHLADTNRHLGNNALAAEQYQAALTIFQQVEGPNGLGVRDALSGLSTVSPQNEVARARDFAQRALAISQSVGDADGATLNNLANVARDRKRYDEAEALYQRACAALEKSGGPDDLRLAGCLLNLGALYRDKDEFDLSKAEPPLKRGLAIREKVLGQEHPETAKALSDLALFYIFEKDPAAAEQAAAKALPIDEKAFGENLELSNTLNRLGVAERDLGALADAQKHLERALAIRKAQHAPGPWLVISMQNLAAVYELEGQQAKATQLISQADAIRAGASNN
jgi:tetratricopeptide (TPR) repeat protein